MLSHTIAIPSIRQPAVVRWNLERHVGVEGTVEDQASDRVWRIGQTRGVEVHTLVCPGTIEERIAKVIEAKRALAGSVIASTETMVTELDDKELESFVQLDVADATGRQ